MVVGLSPAFEAWPWFVAFCVTLVAWVGFEWSLWLRDFRSGTHRLAHMDRSGIWIMAAVAAGLLAAIALANRDIGRLPHPTVWCAVGLVIIWLGLALRCWAVRTLGRFFRLVVVVQADHTIVNTGPYRILRHPAYTGSLLSIIGFGAALASWATIFATVLIPIFGFIYRISVEERTLQRELGEPYQQYMQQTSRLIPGIW